MALKKSCNVQTFKIVISERSEESKHLSGIKDSSFHFVPFRMTRI